MMGAFHLSEVLPANAGVCRSLPATQMESTTERACVVTCLCFRLSARLEKMFDKWKTWRKNKTIRYDFHVVSLALVWWRCSMNFIYSCNVFYRCLRLNTHISSSNISVQTLPKEGGKHLFFSREESSEKSNYLTTWKGHCRRKILHVQYKTTMHLYTPDIEAAAHQSCFPPWSKNP